ERIRSLLTASAESREAVKARGTVLEPQPGGAWELRLETVQGERTWQRTIRARSCDELAGAAARLGAMGVGPDPHAPAPIEGSDTGVTGTDAAPALPPPAASPMPQAAPARPTPPPARQSPPVPRPQPVRTPG